MLFKKMVLVAAVIGSFAAQAEVQNFYVGGQYNKTTLEENESGFSGSVDFGSITALAGYKFNDYLAVEARFGTGVKDKSSNEDGYKESFGVDMQTMLVAKASYNLSNEFSVFAVAGYSKTDFKYEESEPGYSFSETDSLNGLALGIGAEFKFSNNVAVNLEYVMLPDKTFRDGSYSFKLESNNLSLGVNYYF
ncbi:outer membrane beta-barrel protein [Rheinheimera baltica]|uniref:Outer membrane beta-barrel protein n=1 Tax=Rheinheimera baltica TaxID=67576 RepID=A0ABT9HYA8_9GAMM|nr:outer membrane beta-barrel protein [Rheinheimera baltica]MDP5136101.1 outer membrane beta-barrel protein [Rheinheimera baltica]MDP5142938.1 outer membrane beta-barrel protein [Rheinheimera baltica]